MVVNAEKIFIEEDVQEKVMKMADKKASWEKEKGQNIKKLYKEKQNEKVTRMEGVFCQFYANQASLSPSCTAKHAFLLLLLGNQ